MPKVDFETGVRRLFTAAGLVFGCMMGLLAADTMWGRGNWLGGVLAGLLVVVVFSVAGWLLGLILAWVIRGFKGE